MTVSVVHDKQAMNELRDSWGALATARRNPLYSFDWYASCYDNLHGNNDIRIFVNRSNEGKVDAIAPLAVMLQGKTEWLQFAGASFLYEPCGILSAGGTSLQRMYEAIAQDSRPVLLSRLESSGDGIAQDPPKLVQQGLWLDRPATGAPVLNLEGGWDNFMSTLSAKRRSDFRRATRRATSKGSLRFVAEKPDASQEKGLLDLAKKVEDLSWKGRGGSALAKNKRLAAFFDGFCARAATKGHLLVFFLYVNDVPVATAICLEEYDAVWFLKIGYNESYAGCSPGILLLLDIIQYCCDAGISRIEHLGAPAAWLTPWTSQIRPHSTYVHYPLNLRGSWFAARDIVRSAGKNVFHQLGRKRSSLS